MNVPSFLLWHFALAPFLNNRVLSTFEPPRHGVVIEYFIQSVYYQTIYRLNKSKACKLKR